MNSENWQKQGQEAGDSLRKIWARIKQIFYFRLFNFDSYKRTLYFQRAPAHTTRTTCTSANRCLANICTLALVCSDMILLGGQWLPVALTIALSLVQHLVWRLASATWILNSASDLLIKFILLDVDSICTIYTTFPSQCRQVASACITSNQKSAGISFWH